METMPVVCGACGAENPLGSRFCTTAVPPFKRSETAAEWAQRSLDFARPTSRRKYEARSLTLLGKALARLGRRDEALDALRGGARIADSLIGPPERWSAWAALGESAYALGDDDTAAAAYAEANALLASFATTLSPARAERLLAAPQVGEILAVRPVAPPRASP
jgi:tetratricopeptide (TPR) repeat protein